MSKYRNAILRNAEILDTNNRPQLRVPRASESVTTRRTLCAVVVVSITPIYTTPSIRTAFANFYIERRNWQYGEDNHTTYQVLGLTADICDFTGKRSFHIQKSTCANCGYPAAKTRKCTQLPLPRALVT